MNLYETLEVNKTASKKDIRKSYLKLASKYHPDKEGGDTKKMQDIQFAYSILSNDTKRKRYDETGKSDIERALYNRFVEFIYSQLTSLLMSGRNLDDTDIVKVIHDTTSDMIINTKASTPKYKEQIQIINKIKKRFVSKEGDNVFELVLDAKIRELENAIKQTDEFVNMYKEFLKMLTSYECTVSNNAVEFYLR